MDQPIVHPSSNEDWKRYYERKYQEADKQLKEVAWAYAHLLRFAMSGKRKDAYMLTQRVLRKLAYPRDTDPIRRELLEHRQYAGSILRTEEGE